MNDNQYLDCYRNHLNTSNRWGTEESLLFLNQKILGEHVIGSEDAKEVKYEHQLSMEIYKNGKPTVFQNGSAPDIILNNVNNYHWVSLVDPSSGLPLNEKEQRNNLLDICGFNAYLQKILEKAEDFEKSYPQASQEAYAIHAILTKEKDAFIADQSLSSANFYDACKKLMDESSKTELASHRGVKKYFNELLKSIQLIVMGIPIALGKYQLVDPLKTDAMQRLSLLENSLTALKKMKTIDKGLEQTEPPPSLTQ